MPNLHQLHVTGNSMGRRNESDVYLHLISKKNFYQSKRILGLIMSQLWLEMSEPISFLSLT